MRADEFDGRIGAEFVAATLENLEHGDMHSAQIDIEMLLDGFTIMIALVLLYSEMAGWEVDQVVKLLRSEDPGPRKGVVVPRWYPPLMSLGIGLMAGLIITTVLLTR